MYLNVRYREKIPNACCISRPNRFHTYEHLAIFFKPFSVAMTYIQTGHSRKHRERDTRIASCLIINARVAIITNRAESRYAKE